MKEYKIYFLFCELRQSNALVDLLETEIWSDICQNPLLRYGPWIHRDDPVNPLSIFCWGFFSEYVI